jgi:hypothetical protein
MINLDAKFIYTGSANIVYHYIENTYDVDQENSIGSFAKLSYLLDQSFESVVEFSIT